MNKVICISNNNKDRLTIGKQYIVSKEGTANGHEILLLIDDSGQHHYHFRYQFVTINEYRDRQINKVICI